ncbi:uncharacterized protein LOC132197382 isoform X2 [Neocloeon triangulifer]|uniref:uncharacterized protein LOC132197382 isoform X2 n=1 Tax=Neocloeon triangulifer TaxID=2078957 RepID=UPI00286EC653|nr:uncharacterized protein LOC132197382 isoform X2 [Neocloeon triangulifer]
MGDARQPMRPHQASAGSEADTSRIQRSGTRNAKQRRRCSLALMWTSFGLVTLIYMCCTGLNFYATMNNCNQSKEKSIDLQIFPLKSKIKDMAEKSYKRHQQFFNCLLTTKCDPELFCHENSKMLSNGKKYFFSGNANFLKNIIHSIGDWAYANKSCEENGMHLATILDQNHLDALWNESRDVFGETGAYGFRQNPMVKESMIFVG